MEQSVKALERFRYEIDETDAQIIEMLGRRFNICRKIAQLKKEQGIPMMQHGRVEAVKERCSKLGIQNGLNPTLVVDIYTLIIAQSCLLETEIIGRSSD